MKKLLVLLSVFALSATTLMAQKDQEIDHGSANPHKYWMRGYARPGGGGTNNVVYHSGGTVIRNANVVMIFWGPSFKSGGADAAYAAELQAFRNQYGTTGEYNTITQYYGEDNVSGYGNVATGSLVGSQADWFDGTTPPQNVTDSVVRAEVQSYISSHSGADYNAIYEVFLPRTSFSSDGRDASCGAVKPYHLAYCAYHWNYTDASGKQVKYSIEPYPSCGGCQVSGWTDAQDQEHFVTHETREAATDALGDAWFDSQGAEADDKCAWSPSPFIGTGGFGYQYEWSNADNGCVKTK